jgi:hypothetical protein
MSETRETANAAIDPAIPCFAGDIASGRAEDSFLVPKNFAQGAKFLGTRKKCTMLPQAILPFTG